MAEKDIIQNMISRLGQSQDERRPDELDIHFADVDEYTPEDLLLFTKKLAAFVNYYRDSSSVPAGNWTNFFAYDDATLKALLQSKAASTPPHLALLLAFLELYKKPQEIINRITGRHLDFYYQEVLRFVRKAAVPDKAHVLLELKKNASPVSVGPGRLFSAGKDATKVELIYAPTGVTVVNTARVSSLRSVFLDRRAHGVVRYAPIADSADGVGGELTGDEPKWRGFGHRELPPAEVGFAIGSPVLRMREGTRKVTVTLTLSNVESSRLSSIAIKGAFVGFITGEKKWLGPFGISPRLSADHVLQFDFTVPPGEKAVIDYDAAVHGYQYTAQTPILQVLLQADHANIGCNDFLNVTIRKAVVSVEVSNVTSLSLESDGGSLDPRKAFLPFGPQPTKGSRFLVGYAEALAKKLSEVKIKVQWKDAPSDFINHYSDYGVDAVSNDYFTASVSFQDGGCWKHESRGEKLFKFDNASSEHAFEHTFTFAAGTPSVSPAISEGGRVYALHAAGRRWSMRAATSYVLGKPVLTPSKTAPPEVRPGYVTFSLVNDFLHSTYRKKVVENALKYSKQISDTSDPVILNEPYTPAIQTIELAYQAHSDEVDIASASVDEFANGDLHFFHIAYFGQMREHGYQRAQFKFVTDKNVSLLPVYSNEGELLIGFQDLNAGDSVSVLFQVAEGSADPDLKQENLGWFVLCDNYWRPLDRSEVLHDTTNQLLTSGTITFIIPAEATTNSTILPSGHIWLKAAIKQHVNAVCQLIRVAANAVEVQFTDNGNDPGHLLTALEQGRIAKLKSGWSPVKSVKQPYASLGGRPVESDDAFRTRVAERLRHKNRCITAWDYERIILEAFPKVHKVKCIPHAREDCWLAPGHVLIVVVPDLRNKNAMDLLQPKVDADTISRITAHVRERTGMQVQVAVKNPNYQQVQLDFKVKFHGGYEFNYYSKQVEQALIGFLSPWAFAADREIAFGGKVYKSVLLDFVEDLDYVDFVTDFKMVSVIGGKGSTRDINEAQPETPDAILVSAETHIVNQST